MSAAKKTPKPNLNEFMHPRNLYFNNPPDFSQLAMEYPDFREISAVQLNGKVAVDFNDPHVMRTLTRCLLRADFDLEVDLPKGYLSPAVPQRLNYILWCEDIVNVALNKRESVHAVDFGTGSSCIIALLGVRQCGWNFTAVEANADAITFARENIERNDLSRQISLVKTTEGQIQFGEFLNGDLCYDILMCNPPFYRDSWEADATLKAEDQGRVPPRGDCDGSIGEKVTAGGEVEFIRRIYEQSMKYRDRIRVVTAMLGKKKDLKELTRLFQEDGINFTSTEFCQGKTMRWGIAWSFNNVDFSAVPQMKHINPKPPLVYMVPKFIPGVKYTTESLYTRVKELLANVKIRFSPITEGKHLCHLWVLSEKNTLAGQRRRRREKKMCLATIPGVPEHLRVPTSPKGRQRTEAMDTEEKYALDVGTKVAEELSVGSLSAEGVTEKVKVSSKRTRSEDEDEESMSSPMRVEEGGECGECGAAEHHEIKKTYLSTTSDDVSAYFLNCDVRVRRTASGLILQLQNRDQTKSRDGLCQLLQYLRNNLCSEPKDLALTLRMIV